MINLSQEEIMQGWPENKTVPTLSVNCITYNQEAYIGQTLDGFLMQKTSFPFEVVVHDDASTDKTADIIRSYEEKYPDIIKPIYEKENQYSKMDGSLNRIVNSALKGKYVAICEGDDYWIDPYKLQKQVDFLENHEDYMLVYTDYMQLYEDKHMNKIECFDGSTLQSCFERLITGNFIGTLTVCFRKNLLDKIDFDEFTKRKFLMTDYPMWLSISLAGKFFHLKDCTAVYRVLANSASHSTDWKKNISFEKSVYDIQEYFLEKNPEYSWMKKKMSDLYYSRLLTSAFKNGNRKLCLDLVKKIKNKNTRMKLASVVFRSRTAFFLAFLIRERLRIKKIKR